MKKLLLILTGFALAIAVLGAAGFVYAQSGPTPQPQTPQADQPAGQVNEGAFGLRMFMRPGRMGQRGAMPGVMPGAMQQAMQDLGWKQGAFGPGQLWDDSDGPFAPLKEYMQKGLAQALGVTIEDLQARMQAGETVLQIAEAQGLTMEQFRANLEQAKTDMLAQAVADGALTQAQADWLKDKPLGPMGMRNTFMLGMQKMGGVLHETMHPAMAAAFGLTADELQTRLDNGETLWQIGESQNLTLQQFREKMTQARTAAIDQALADGKITQEQADQMKANMGDGFWPGACGGFGGRAHPGPMPWFNQP